MHGFLQIQSLVRQLFVHHCLEVLMLELCMDLPIKILVVSSGVCYFYYIAIIMTLIIIIISS